MTPISPVTGWSLAGCAIVGIRSRKPSLSKCYNSVVDLFVRTPLANAGGFDLRRVDIIRVVQRQPVVSIARLFAACQLQTGFLVFTAGIVYMGGSHTVGAVAGLSISHPEEELLVHSPTSNRLRDRVRSHSYAGLRPASALDRVQNVALHGILAF